MSKLKDFRLRVGLTQTAVAKKLKCTSSAVNQYESGKRTPRFETLVQLAKIYNCSVADFVEEKESV